MKKKEIYPGIEIVGLTLYIRREDTLVFCDTHLGYEEELRSLGYPVPRQQYREIIRHLSGVFSRIRKKKVGRIVINGDLKHEFGRISSQEWKEVLGLLDYLGKRCKELILVKGNHDTVLGPLAGRKGLAIVDHFFMKDAGVYVCHGDKIRKDADQRRAKTIIVGHEHPAVKLSDGVRSEKVKCFIAQKAGKSLVIMPSLCFSTEGSDIINEAHLSPYMDEVGGEAFVYCVEGFDVYSFGKLKGLCWG